MRSEQTDVPIKNLLKQVYAAHTAKVKCLEDEIEELKKNLLEAEKNLKEHDSDCKRCSELEEAFTTCKAALEEQTKWFESFGQKFSIFNSSENKVSSKTSKLQDDIMQIYNENSFASDKIQSNQTNEKSSVTKKTFLKNLMSSTPDKVQDSLDLCTVAFPGNLGPSCSSLNFDSMVLAPDTVDIAPDVQNNVLKHCRTERKLSKSSAHLKDITDKSKDYSERNKSNKKRMCSDSSDSEKSPNKKFNKGVGKDSPKKKKTVENKTVKKKEPIVEEHTISDLVESSNAKLLNDKTIDFFDFKTSKNNIPMDTNNNKEKVVSIFDSEINQHSNIEDSVKIPSIEKEKNCLSKPEHTINKDSIYGVSPSLIPLNKKNEKNILQNQPMLAEDISDFQVPTINKNPPEMVDAWKTCDKKKTKKGQSAKNIKLTSKFKMSLDALPPNYKKPNLRQTKLSKSIFQPKNSNDIGFSNEAKKILSDSSNSSSELSKNISPVNKSNKTNTVDFDATCIPENYKYNEESCDDEESILLIQDESSDESLHSPAISPKTKVRSITKEDASKENKKKDKFEDFLCDGKVNNEHLNSFDRLPKREEPNYKYKEETVRKKSERKQLNGFECKECEKYFADLGLSEEEKRERLNKCSRHRAKFPPPATPEHFWELDFPDTQECKARGYLNETQKVTLKTHRRRPL